MQLCEHVYAREHTRIRIQLCEHVYAREHTRIRIQLRRTDYFELNEETGGEKKEEEKEENLSLKKRRKSVVRRTDYFELNEVRALTKALVPELKHVIGLTGYVCSCGALTTLGEKDQNRACIDYVESSLGAEGIVS
jgi:hypothetical protein